MDDSDSNGQYINNYIQPIRNNKNWQQDDEIGGYNNQGFDEMGGYGKQQQKFSYDKINNRMNTYISNYDPRIEKKKINSYWTIGDDVLLLQLVEKLGKDNWKQVTDKIKTKDITDCQRRYAMIRDTKEFEDEEEEIDLTWTPQEDSLLLFAYRKYRGNWHKIWLRFQHRDKASLQQRWMHIVEQQNQIFWDINKDSKVIHNYIHNCKFNNAAPELGLSDEQCENRFHHIIAKLSQQLEKKGVKVELPKKVLDATIYNEQQLPLSVQPKLQHIDNNQAADLIQQTNQINDKLAKIQIDQILNDQIPIDTANNVIKSKIENLTITEQNNQQIQNIQNKYDKIKVNEEQILNENDELKINHDQKERNIINETILMIRKSLELEQQHFDSLFEIKELLLQNIFLCDRIMN